MANLRVVAGSGDTKKTGRPPGPGFDEWSTEGFKYSSEHFYTRSKNAEDSGFRDIHLRVPEYLYGWAMHVVSEKLFSQLRSPNDLIRDALVHRCHELLELLNDEEFAKTLTRDMRKSRTEQRRADIESMKNSIVGHRSVLESAYAEQDTQAMSDELADVEDDVHTARYPYNQRLKELAREYRERLKQMIASFPPENNDEG